MKYEEMSTEELKDELRGLLELLPEGEALRMVLGFAADNGLILDLTETHSCI